ncbi:terminase large subunit [Candidatus Pacearchaeota archaeon]|jgi:phage terminase large subunit-like protein|nr:terminase large subunit [Candidatus Pacearchaeota archaeon]
MKRARTPADKHAIASGCYYDDAAGNHVCEFFERFLSLSKGQWAGKSFRLLEWQREKFLKPLFGWRRADGTRRFRLGYVEIPKKNGKSAMCSGIALYLAFADGEPGAEVYLAAADRDQAGIVYGESKNMVMSSAELSKFCRVTDSKKRIDLPQSNSFIRAISSEAYTAEGLNIHGLIFDELHAQKNRELWDTLRYGGAARRQPLLISITTAGWDTASICYEQHEYARRVLSGEIEDDAFFGLIYAADREDDPLDPATWAKANPSLGETIQAVDMEQAAKEAIASPVKLNGFRRYRLNIWTEQAERWLDADAWEKCSTATDALAWREEKLEELSGCECYGGLDLGSTSDITALVLFFPEGGILLPWFWVPESALQNDANPNRDLYRTWAEQKLLTVTPGNVCDYDRVREDIKTIAETFGMRELAVDRLFQGAQLCTQLMDDGHDVIAFGQGHLSMAAPCREFEERVLSNKFDHGSNPVLRWMAGNCSVKTDPAGNMKPCKPARMSQHKIDGIVAAIMALGRGMLQIDEYDGDITII